jgi:hypothetical protein
MQAVEFISEVTKDGEVRIPSALAATVPQATKVRVILLFPDEKSGEEADWSRLTAQQFLDGYAPEDAIYDRD